MTMVACQTKICRSKKVPFLGLRTLKLFLDNLNVRFPSCGTNVEVYAVANFVDPNKKGRLQKKTLRESVISFHQLPK